jgi:hypothetical protein
MQRRASREMELDGICRGIWRGVSILILSAALPVTGSGEGPTDEHVRLRGRLEATALALGGGVGTCLRAPPRGVAVDGRGCMRLLALGRRLRKGRPLGLTVTHLLPSVKVSPAESHPRSWTSIHFHILQTCAPILMDTLSSRARWCGGNTSACTALPRSGARTGLMCLTIS